MGCRTNLLSTGEKISYFEDKKLTLEKVYKSYQKYDNFKIFEQFANARIDIIFSRSAEIIDKLNHFITILEKNNAREQAQITKEITPEQVTSKKYTVKEICEELKDAGKVVFLPEQKKIIRKGDKMTIPDEYRIKTTVSDVENFLTQNNDRYKISDIRQFMKNNLKGKKGGYISNSFKTEKSVKKRKIS